VLVSNKRFESVQPLLAVTFLIFSMPIAALSPSISTPTIYCPVLSSDF